MNRILLFTVVATLAAILVVGTTAVLSTGVAAPPPPSKFSTKTLKGAYGVFGDGLFNGVRFDHVAIWVFDGSGGCTYWQTIDDQGGTTTEISSACSYTVNPNGTGTITTTLESTFTFNDTIVIVKGGEEFFQVNTDANIRFSSVVKRQN